MNNGKNIELLALRDFFLATTDRALCAAFTKLADTDGPEISLCMMEKMDWEALEFVFNKLFVGPKRLQAPPYASCYLEPEPQLMGSSTLRVRRMYEMAGFCSPLAGHLPCDHIGVELDAAAGMLTMAAQSKCDEPQALWRYFLNDHMRIWVPLFLDRIRQAKDHHLVIDRVASRLETWLNKQEKEKDL